MQLQWRLHFWNVGGVIQYEQLPYLCFHCGLFCHTVKHCPLLDSEITQEQANSSKFGALLNATGDKGGLISLVTDFDSMESDSAATCMEDNFVGEAGGFEATVLAIVPVSEVQMCSDEGVSCESASVEYVGREGCVSSTEEFFDSPEEGVGDVVGAYGGPVQGREVEDQSAPFGNFNVVVSQVPIDSSNLCDVPVLLHSDRGWVRWLVRGS